MCAHMHLSIPVHVNICASACVEATGQPRVPLLTMYFEVVSHRDRVFMD